MSEEQSTTAGVDFLAHVELEAAKRELSTIKSSAGFRLVQNYWGFRESILPPGTIRGSVYDSLKKVALKVVQGDGLGGPLIGWRPAPSGEPRPWHFPLTRISRSLVDQRIVLIAELSMRACRTYRVDHKVEMFKALGFAVSVVSWNDFSAARHALQSAAMAVFYRVPAMPEVKVLVTEAERLGVPIAFDIDDLIFDPKTYVSLLEETNLNEDAKALLLHGAGLYREMLALCRNGIASTPTIAEAMKQVVDGSVDVITNAIDPFILKVASEMRREPRPPRDPAKFTIGYGSGSDTHDGDLGSIAPALVRLLRTYPQVQIAFHGPLRPPPEFSKFKSRVFTIPFLDPGDYYRAIASWDVSIAPLTQHQFNDAKSNIKFLEASVFGVPSVCSPTEPFRAAVNHGKNGMLATTEAEWFDAIETLLKDPPLRKKLGEQARRDVVKRYSLKSIGEREVRRLLPTVNRTFPKHRPRVLEVNLLFSPTSFGGATVVAEQMATRLSREGVEVGVVTGLNDTGFPPLSLVRYEALGLPVFGIQLPAGGDPVLEYRNHSLGIVFGQVLDTFKPDVVHFHSIQQLSASMLEVCRERKIPFVVTAHDAWWLCQRQFMVDRDNRPCGQSAVDLRVCSTCVPDAKVLYDRDRALRSALSHAALILTPSKFQRRLYLENGFSRDRVRLNKNGVSIPVRATPRQRDARASLRLGYMGGKAHHKGYFWLREILKRVRGENYTFKLVDIHRKMGPSPIKLADFKIRGKLDVVAPFNADRADEFYAGIDVLLMPSLAPESFGLSVREALARNVWVITTDAGALGEEIVDGENGNVIRVGDTAAFANAIDRLLAGSELTNYDNPHRKKIRGYEEQALELKEFLLEAIKHKSTATRQGA